MKNSSTCVKCDSIDVVMIPGGSFWKGYSNAFNITQFKSIVVSRYVCVNCGYSEEWIDAEKDLRLIEKHFNKSGSISNDFV